ncbi:hypothetical protein [Oceanobacillus salinisoli]|uniref:hypothetical protein n=1 Tax=Oceanobacillus salinisoli TaxID=2678611 RepID=UPI001E3A4D46|nr:hypothetical protein [Oceanobacillus salinisoli]
MTRKKSLPYDEWLNRTLKLDNEKIRVTNYQLHSSEEIQDYYDIKISNNHILSFAIDEWMIIADQKTKHSSVL